jgi:hypothetical protein
VTGRGRRDAWDIGQIGLRQSDRAPPRLHQPIDLFVF